MKKFIILLLSIFLAMSLAACGNKTDSRDSSGKTEIKDAKELLTTVWNSYEEDEKFAIAGGDMTEENMTEDAPGTFGITDADELDRMLGFPAADAEKIDNAASIMHMMNANTFTCGAEWKSFLFPGELLLRQATPASFIPPLLPRLYSLLSFQPLPLFLRSLPLLLCSVPQSRFPLFPQTLPFRPHLTFL